MARKKKKYIKAQATNNTPSVENKTTEESKIDIPVTKEYSVKDPYYILIAGSRTIDDYDLIKKYLNIEFATNGITSDKYDINIVEGEATGVDQLAKKYAFENKYQCRAFPAAWNLYGNKAGFIRNKVMHQYLCDNAPRENRICICFKDENSHGKGTSHSIILGRQFGTNVVWYDVSNSSMQRTFYENKEPDNTVEDENLSSSNISNHYSFNSQGDNK